MLAVRVLQNRKHLTKYICVSNVIKREISDDTTQPPKLKNNNDKNRKNRNREKREFKKKEVIDPVLTNTERQTFSSDSWKSKLNKKYKTNVESTKFKSDFFQNLVEASTEDVAKELKMDAKTVKTDLLDYLKTFDVSREKGTNNTVTERYSYILSSQPSLRSIFKHVEPLRIFKENYSSEQVQLNIWNDLEKEELAYKSTTHPANYFEEQIQWTKEGRLWHFPIDNDQGLEEEAKISFTEHIFLERHLEPWCPKKGPLRKFMEMVLIGLGKNPYLSVKDKKEHIEWFRNYFEGKKKLLQDLGAIGTTKEIEATTQEPKSPET